MGFAELHLHLEGTVDRDTVRMLDPLADREELDRVWAFADFPGFLECFKFVARRLRGPADYALVTRRMMQALHRQSISYAEVTLGAGVVQWLGYDFDSVWREIREAQKDAYRESPVEIWWNLDAIRQLGPEHVMEIAKLTARYVDDGVISFGIGGDEQRGPALEFRKAYEYAKDAGLRLTAHAGETGGPESVRNALDIGAERIGHGIRAIEDAGLCRRLRDERIPLEVCITSNVRTGAVSSLEAHPIKRLVDAGVIVTLNTDDPGMFGSDLATEFRLAKDVFGLTDGELAAIRQNAVDYRFRKQRLQ
jgi:adenosine deaminase/aminodeoxyfutalosine deaminase